MAGQYMQPVQYGKGPPIKAGQPEPAPHLGTTCEIHHIYEDLNESSSARPGGSQQLEIPPSLNSMRAACFSSPASFSSSRWFFFKTLVFYQARGFQCLQGFFRLPVFAVNAGISQIRLIFSKTQGFLKST
jgi:hypothetical protein